MLQCHTGFFHSQTEKVLLKCLLNPKFWSQLVEHLSQICKVLIHTWECSPTLTAYPTLCRQEKGTYSWRGNETSSEQPAKQGQNRLWETLVHFSLFTHFCSTLGVCQNGRIHSTSPGRSFCFTGRWKVKNKYRILPKTLVCNTTQETRVISALSTVCRFSFLGLNLHSLPVWGSTATRSLHLTSP